MSVIGSPIETSALQAAQAQQTASKARDRERASGERARRSEDQVELRVAGVESAEAVRSLPHNDSEEAEEEHQSASRRKRRGDADEAHPQIDLRA